MDTMQDTSETLVRPVPRWLRVWALLTLLVAVVLITIGGFVTSFRAGMADPVWPTEPWYLIGKDWGSLEFGFLIEHTHRLAGWILGIAATVLAIGAFAFEPNRAVRWFGLLSMVVLLGTYGEFHREMRKVWNSIQEQAAAEFHHEDKHLTTEDELHQVAQGAVWPEQLGLITAGCAGLVLLAGVLAGLTGRPGSGARFAASFALVFVMVQGLLGGFRVFLNELAGTDLAAVHGVFGQVTFCVLVAVVVFCAPRPNRDALPPEERRGITGLSWWLVGLLLMQLVWAVMVRHQGTALGQRLHILTAFLVTGVIIWLVMRIMAGVQSRTVLRGAAIHLTGILAVQVLLGVEAYMGKFAAVGPQATVMPTLRDVTPAQAGIRTAHQLVGTGLLAAAVALALRSGRRAYATSQADRQTVG